MRTLFVVLLLPRRDLAPRVEQVLEPDHVQALVAQSSADPSSPATQANGGVLIWVFAAPAVFGCFKLGHYQANRVFGHYDADSGYGMRAFRVIAAPRELDSYAGIAGDSLAQFSRASRDGFSIRH
jgi:hypothetical protein